MKNKCKTCNGTGVIPNPNGIGFIMCPDCQPNIITSGKAAYIVIILFTLLAMIFGGCIDSSYTNEPYVIKKILPLYPKADNPTICIYSDFNQQNWEIIDSCFKYNVGDTIRLTSQKW